MSSHSAASELNDSWVELGTYQGQVPVATAVSSQERVSPSPVKTVTVNNGAMEKLLLEAQRESSYSSSSRIDSIASSRGSPKSPHSPSNELTSTPCLMENDEVPPLSTAEWVWDWSSRPEIVPPSDWGSQFKHPIARRHKLSIRNTRVMQGILFSLENLPILLFTHACTFILGAATMLVYLKKYCNWSAVSPAATLD